MDIRRQDRKKDEEFALKLVEECEYATLASISPDNTPYCIPVSPVLVDNYVYFHGAKEGHKVDNFNYNKNVCINCVGKTKLIPEKFTTEYESAILFGEVEIVEDEKEKSDILIKICEKYAASNMKNAPKAIQASLHRTGIYKVKIKRITAKAKK